MTRIVHPTPVVAIAKAAAMGITLSVLVFLVKDYARAIFWWALGLIWLITCLGSALSVIMSRLMTLEIGEKNLLFKKGLLSVKTVLVPYSKVTDARYTQSLVERIFGVGTLEVETASESETAIRMPSVHYEDVKEIMQNVSDNPEVKGG